MKQKRKVKSLIPSKSGSNVFLTTLLFLLGGILCFGAVRLFTSSMGVEAADAGSIEYPGIADKHEVLLKFGLIPKGGDTPLNEMYLTGTTFVISGDNGVSVNIGNSNDLDKYVNYLGGDGGMNISSDNITIIGGSADEIYQNNDDATVLGGMHNKVDEGNNKASPVILGGEGRNDAGYKTIGKNQEGSAVVGGQNNEIKDNGSYDFILGGENNKIDGSNVIVGGSRVNVDEKSNVFAFSHGDSAFEPESENAFYLNLKNGLGLNRKAVNDGVDSHGAVSFGEVNIVTQKCTSADKGVQGTWQGCLVGCTETSAALSPSKWEMIDHGTGCEKICENNSSYCMINPIKIEANPYTSYCTNIGVDTGHSHHCGGEENILPIYKDVLFETVLIDSDAKCPDPADPNNWTENRCVFKCDGGYHLTGGADGRARCYKDCELVWDHSTIKHNETVTAYKRTDVNCSYNSDAQKGPYTCKNYKATLVCDNGTLKVKQSFASSTENGKDAYDLGYQYNECMLHQYRCPATYNYNKSQIDSLFKDAPTNGRWNIQNRQKIVGTRGQYKLCVDYDAVTRNTVQYLDGESCFERDKNADNSYNLHYQWLGCNDHYHTGSRSNYVCMKDCTLKDPNGTTRYYLHETRITGYKNGSVDCGSAGNGKCESETLVCNDGKWRKGSLNGAITEDYKYNDCSLNDFNCSLTEYNVDESTKTAHQGESVYASSCISYDGQDDKVTCSKRRTDYKLTNCVGGHSTYHTENNMRCISNEDERQCTHAGATVSHHFHYINALVPVRWSGTAYNNGSWSTPANCGWECDTNYHEDEEEGDCISNSRNVNCSDYYTLPANASWKRQGYQTWNISQGRWNSPLYCSWDCNSGWHENAAGTACEKDCTVVSCSAYTLDSCPDHGHCSECTKVDASCNDGETKLQLDYCDTDYEVSSDGTSCEYNPSCTANYCSAYGLDECPEGGICSYCTIKYTDCTNGDQKARLDSCEEGWTKVGDTCQPAGSRPGGDDGGNPGGGDDVEVPCSYDGNNYVEGDKVSVYASTSPTCPTNCSTVTATCQSDGSWDKTMNKSCTPKPSGDCSDYPLESKNVSHAKSYNTCTYYTVSSNSCKTNYKYSVECEDGYHRSADGKSCEPDASQCTYDGTTYDVGDKVSVYASTSPTCPTNCSTVTATCQSDGSWDKTMNKSCTPKPSGDCSDYPLESKNVSNAKSYNTCTYYTVSSNSCKTNYKYSVECEDGYYLSSDGKSCLPLCNSSTNPGSCNGGFSPVFGGVATYLSSYSYTCNGYSCSANCPSGNYWLGYNCNEGNSLCGSTHDICVSSSSLVSGSSSSKTSGNTTTYTWSCNRGDKTQKCTQTVTTCDAGEEQACLYPDTGNAEGRWYDASCSCDCPIGTTFDASHGCECPSGQYWDGSKCVELETGGDTCDEYREFNPSWAPWGSSPKESDAADAQCTSDAGEGWTCAYSYYEPGHPSMCECERSAQCQSCTGCPSGTVAHNGKCTSYNQSSACTCPTARTSTCDNGSWDLTPYSYGSCTSGVGCSSGGGSSGGGGGGCFLAGTPVITSEGPKNIEDIEVGDMVLSYNTVTLQNEYNKVTKLMIHENNNDDIYELVINGKLLEVTSVHPFFVVNDNQKDNQCNMQFKIRRAQSLKVGDKLMMSDGTYVTIESITHRHNYGTVYNFEVENVHNYFVGEGYLVHNIQQKEMMVADDAIGDGYGGNCGVTVNAFRNEGGALCGRYDSCNGSFSTAGC